MASGIDTVAEFERQVGTLIARGYPRAAGLGEPAFREQLEPLAAHASELPSAGAVPFVIVIRREVVPAHEAIARVERRGKAGFSVIEPGDLRRFDPIAGVELPGGSAYLLSDIDTGADTRNITPDEALSLIEAAGRSPLTIEEGIAVVTHYPEAVAKNGGFSLLASRCGDRRVTALWISQGRPKLGWCWAGNPHTWLGSASCARRIGAHAPGARQAA